MQSKKDSLAESISSVFIGLIIAILGQLIIYPIMEIPVTFLENLQIAAFFTVLSIARGYLVRRYYNKKLRNNDT